MAPKDYKQLVARLPQLEHARDEFCEATVARVRDPQHATAYARLFAPQNGGADGRTLREIAAALGWAAMGLTPDDHKLISRVARHCAPPPAGQPAPVRVARTDPLRYQRAHVAGLRASAACIEACKTNGAWMAALQQMYGS